MNLVSFGDIYRHFKGGEYMVLGFAHDEANRNGPGFVIYVNVKTWRICWARKIDVWFETVMIDDQPCRRFEYVKTPLWARAVRRIAKLFIRK